MFWASVNWTVLSSLIKVIRCNRVFSSKRSWPCVLFHCICECGVSLNHCFLSKTGDGPSCYFSGIDIDFPQSIQLLLCNLSSSGSIISISSIKDRMRIALHLEHTTSKTLQTPYETRFRFTRLRFGDLNQIARAWFCITAYLAKLKTVKMILDLPEI